MVIPRVLVDDAPTHCILPYDGEGLWGSYPRLARADRLVAALYPPTTIPYTADPTPKLSCFTQGATSVYREAL